MSFGFKEQQTLKYPNAMFCSISIQEPGVKVDGGSNNNFTITQACINAMRIASTPFAPYDFSLEKEIIMKYDEQIEQARNEMHSKARSDEGEEDKESSHSDCSTTEASIDNDQSSTVMAFSSPFLANKYTELPEEFRKRWDEMKNITQCSDVMCFDLLEKHGYILNDAIEHFFNLP